MLDEYFEKIGSELVRRWEPETFHEAAHDVLAEYEPPEDFSFASLTQWAVNREELPNQVNFHSGFGAPPLVVYADEENRFYAEILVWFPSRTAIHGHGFSGAFRVLEGYSIQGRYFYDGVDICVCLKQC